MGWVGLGCRVDDNKFDLYFICLNTTKFRQDSQKYILKN